MGGKCRVITAAVLRMKNKRNIQYLRLQFRITAVRMQHLQNIFCKRKFRSRIPDHQILIQMIMTICMVTIYCNQRELGNQTQFLFQYIRNCNIVRIFIVRIQRQNTFLKRIHHILARSLHNDIAHERIRQIPVIT